MVDSTSADRIMSIRSVGKYNNVFLSDFTASSNTFNPCRRNATVDFSNMGRFEKLFHRHNLSLAVNSPSTFFRLSLSLPAQNVLQRVGNLQIADFHVLHLNAP